MTRIMGFQILGEVQCRSFARPLVDVSANPLSIIPQGLIRGHLLVAVLCFVLAK